MSIGNEKRYSAHGDCNINVKSNYKTPVIFYNLKNYNSHLVMQELDKLNLKLNIIPTGLEKYIRISINNKLSFIDSFQFLRSLLGILVKSLGKYNFKI